MRRTVTAAVHLTTTVAVAALCSLGGARRRLLRDLAVGLFVVAGIGFGLLFVGTGVASAYVHPVPPVSDPTYETGLTELVDGGATGGLTFPETWTYPDGSQGPPPNWWQQDVPALGNSAGRLPSIWKAGGALLTAGVGFDIGWKIGRTIDTKFLHLQDPNCIVFGCAAQPSGSPVAKAEYLQPHAPCNPTYWTCATGSYYYNLQLSGSTTSDTAIYCGSTVMGATYFVDGGGYSGGSSCYAEFYNVDQPYFAADAIAHGFTKSAVPGCDTSAVANAVGLQFTPPGGCFVLLKPDDAGKSLVHSPVETYSGQHADVTTTMPSSGCTVELPCAPAANMTAAQYSALLAAVGASDPGVSGGVNCLLASADYVCPTGPTDPGTGKAPPASIALPSPDPGETYGGYVARLRAQGFLGKVTLLDDPNYETGGDTWGTGYTSSDLTNPFPPGTCVGPCSPGEVALPGTVTRVAVGAITGTNAIPVYAPDGSWAPTPDTPPNYSPSTTPEIQVYKVPALYTPPVNPEPGNTPGAPPGSGDGVPSVVVPPIVGACDKFPFGVFCWIGDQISAMVSQPKVYPSISMTIPSETISGYTIGSYGMSWDFGSTEGMAFDGYITIVRDALAFLLWLGGTYYLGTRLLAMHGAPDPRVGGELGGS